MSFGVKSYTLACKRLSGSAEARVTSGVARWLRCKYEWLYVNANLFRIPSQSTVNVKRARKTDLSLRAYAVWRYGTRVKSLSIPNQKDTYFRWHESVPQVKNKLLIESDS